MIAEKIKLAEKKKSIYELQKSFNINHIYAHTVYSRSRRATLHEDAKLIIQSKPKPFVKWVGGKRQLLEQFRSMNLYPPESFDPATGRYFEPFVGGGAVFFDLMPRKAYLSDLNSELVTTYNVIKDDVESLIQSLEKHKTDKEYFLKIRAKDPKTLKDLNIASRFIYLNRTCFNGMYRVNSIGGFNVPYGKYTNPKICDADNLRKVSESLKEVSITNQDYKEVIKKAKKGDYIYFDPPYDPLNKTSSFTSYTKEAFLDKQQTELRDTYIKLHKKGCFVMLSNSDTPFINELYGNITGVKISKVRAGRSINSVGSKRGKISEVLVTNY